MISIQKNAIPILVIEGLIELFMIYSEFIELRLNTHVGTLFCLFSLYNGLIEFKAHFDDWLVHYFIHYDDMKWGFCVEAQ